MAQFTSTICDGCKKVKAETNNWFRVLISFGSFQVFHSEAQLTPQGQSEKVLDLCGHECAGKKLSEWMGAAESTPDRTALEVAGERL